MFAGENDGKAHCQGFFDELVLIRKEKGLRRLPADQALPLLERLARALSADPAAPMIEQIKHALERATSHLAERRAKAVAALLDFGERQTNEDEAEKMWTVEDLRTQAAAALGLTSPSSDQYFKKILEKPLLNELAASLARLLVEHGPDAEPAEQSVSDHTQTPEPTTNAKSVAVETFHALVNRDEDSKHRVLGRRRAIAVTCLLLLAVGIGVALQLTSGTSKRRISSNRIVAVVLPGDCSETTAQLFNPYITTRRIVAGSELYMYVPHQTSPDTHYGWVKVLEYSNPMAHIEVIHAAEVRQFALSYHNDTNLTARQVVAKVALPPGGSLVPNSVCLYRNGEYRYGTRYNSPTLAQASGLSIGTYAPGASAYVTFSVLLPDVRHLSCGRSEVSLYGKAGTKDLDEPYWSQNASGVVIQFERRCHT
jgi:hypothetical protein